MIVVLFLFGFIFYLGFPLWGAWRVRRSWNIFRGLCLEALSSTEVSLFDIEPNLPAPHTSRLLIGTLEAFEGTHRLWIGNTDLSLPVSLKNSPVYFLDEPPGPFVAGVEPPRKAEASSLGALSEGTNFLVFGHLESDEKGQTHFAATDAQSLLVMAFEGDPHTVLNRAIYAGRATIDHWNSWTPVSLAAGMTAFLFWGYLNLTSGGWRSGGILALVGALLPSTFFLPPGIFLFYAFARLWSQARDHRARMDLVRLSMGKDAAPWKQLRDAARKREWLAHILLGIGMLTNAALLAFVLRLWVP